MAGGYMQPQECVRVRSCVRQARGLSVHADGGRTHPAAAFQTMACVLSGRMIGRGTIVSVLRDIVSMLSLITSIMRVMFRHPLMQCDRRMRPFMTIATRRCRGEIRKRTLDAEHHDEGKNKRSPPCEPANGMVTESVHVLSR